MYMYQLVRRKKDNPLIKKDEKLWYISHNEEENELDVCRLLRKKANTPGLWRIYRSVNRRDEVKAKLDLIDIVARSLVNENKKPIEGIWRSCLMSPENKLDRFFLVDIDTENHTILSVVKEMVGFDNVINEVETVNGYHLVTKPFNPNLLKCVENVEVKKDAFLLVDYFLKGKNLYEQSL